MNAFWRLSFFAAFWLGFGAARLLSFGDFFIARIVSPIPAWRKRRAGSGNGPDRGKETPLPALRRITRRGTHAWGNKIIRQAYGHCQLAGYGWDFATNGKEVIDITDVMI